MNIKEICNSDEKVRICNEILKTVPGCIEIDPVKDMPFFTACVDEKVIGFVAIKNNNEYTSKIYLIGTLDDFQNTYENLIKHCEEYCVQNNKEFLITEAVDNKNFVKFGFKPLTCKILIKHISQDIHNYDVPDSYFNG